jgi:hypothetical protein
MAPDMLQAHGRRSCRRANPLDAGEQLAQVRLHDRRRAGLAQQLQQVVVAQKVEP